MSRSKAFAHIAQQHPCFMENREAPRLNRGRIHLPVSPDCNIQCRFCRRAFNRKEERPGVSAGLVKPAEAAALVKRALELCPQITVAGIAGPGDTLATHHALETFAGIHQEFPELIKCISTNGLRLEEYAEALIQVGVKTITVTMNAVIPEILERICSRVIVDGKIYSGIEGASLLIEAQKRGIRKAAALGAMIKINMVLIPWINGDHIGEIARTAGELGAHLVNIIPLIPQFEFEGCPPPDCEELRRAREAAEQWLPVFRHCQHCRADACGVLGKEDLAPQLYGEHIVEETFSHG